VATSNIAINCQTQGTHQKEKKLTVRKCWEAFAKSVSKEEWKPCNDSFNKPDENGDVEVVLGS
jgi:hypothetical protein